MVLKSAPWSGSTSESRGWKFVFECDVAVQFAPRFDTRGGWVPLHRAASMPSVQLLDN